MKKCLGCGSISQDADITCGVCGANIANAPLLEGSIEDEIIREQEKTQKQSARKSKQRPARLLNLETSSKMFFRHCPGCARRFHIKLESKKLLHIDRETIRKPQVARVAGYAGAGVRFGREGSPGYGGPGSVYQTQQIILSEGEPVIIDIEDVQYNYKCKHCGHEWSEKRTEKHKES